jgi:hypothetical protein
MCIESKLNSTANTEVVEKFNTHSTGWKQDNINADH